MTGKQAFQIVREYFPGISDGDMNVVLWEFTGWPCFWDGDPETCLRRQLEELRSAPPSAPEAETGETK